MVIRLIRQDLARCADPEIQKTCRRFFKEEIRCYGMKTAAVAAIAKKYWSMVGSKSKQEIFSLCEYLYRSGCMEESFIASAWTARLSKRYDRGDLATFRHWIETYITNWASCDGFCTHTVGAFIQQYPDTIADLLSWTRSENRWLRRAAAVSLVLPARRGKFLAESLEIADLILIDNDPMVQKGYGWLLKEAARMHPCEIFSFVMERKQRMPRTALRYAIERLPKDMKAEAMKKDW